MCCYELSRKWRPGIQVRVHITRWLPKKLDGGLSEVNETHMVEVPSYVNGKPGELWVLRNADGTVSVVSSAYQPDPKFLAWLRRDYEEKLKESRP